MPKSNYISQNANAFSAQLTNFASILPTYSTDLSVTAAQVTSAENDAAYLGAVVTAHELMTDISRQWVSYRDNIRNGGPAGAAPVLPNLSMPIPAATPGVEVRFRALVKQIKASAGYNDSIGEALGIEGPEHTGPDLTTIQPDIDATISGGQVHVKSGWGGNSAYLDLCEIQVDRADSKGFVALCFDTTPNYTDTTPPPVKWTYQAIYHVGDHASANGASRSA